MILRLAIMLSAGAVLAQVPPGADARRSDTYGVYSRLIPLESASDDTYLVMGKAIRARGPIRCSPVQSRDQQRLAEVMADFNARTNSTPDLEEAFTLSKPYRLLTEAEASEFVAASVATLRNPGAPPAPSANPRLQGARTLLSVSDVFFDANRTLAAVFINSMAGPLAAKSTWRMFEKLPDGGWGESDSFRCMLTSIA